MTETNPTPTPEEAAALIAAIERFLVETTPVSPAGAAVEADPWRRAALLEGLRRLGERPLQDPWLNI